MKPAAPRHTFEEGSISIEFAIVMSALIVGFFSLMIVAGRIVTQENEVRSAAGAAARAASLVDTVADARLAARDVATQNLADSGVNCQSQQIDIVSDPVLFEPGGIVTVRVRCTAGTIALLGLAPNDYSYDSTEVIDAYRGRP